MTSLKTVFAGMFVVAAIASASAAAPANAVARPAKVGIGLETTQVSPALLKSQIRRQALSQGVKLSDDEIDTAVNTATNKLKGVGPGPQKGIIHLKFKKFTICISWGRDKGYCQAH